jgi:LacI family transcriptional regulator
LDAAKQLNYQKNELASDLKWTNPNTIALILSELSGHYYSELIKGVQDVTSTNGYTLIACSSIGGAQSTAIKFSKEKRVDGVIILAHNITDETILESTRKGFPIVVVDRDINHGHVLQVEVDNVEGGFHATEHLMMKGHRNIAYISAPYNSHDNELRFPRFKQALEKHGITYRSKWKTSDGCKATKTHCPTGYSRSFFLCQ